jgi:hypothetical protein
MKRLNPSKLMVFGFILVFLLAAFAPVLSQSANAIICRFEATACETVWNSNDDVFYRDAGGTETIRVDGQGSMRIAVPTQVGTATPGLVIQQGANGNAVEVRNSGGTPTWYTTGAGVVTQSGAQTFSGLLNANAGIAVDTSAFTVADTSGNTQINGTLGVTGATTLVGALGSNGGLTVDSTAFTVADTSGNTQIAGTLGVTGATTLTGNTDVVGTLQYGANDLYPLGYASVNQQIVCGTTIGFTATTVIEPTGLTTTTYPLAIQITQPASTAAYLTVTAPTTAAFTIQSWGGDFNAGSTEITAHWCAVGDQ